MRLDPRRPAWTPKRAPWTSMARIGFADTSRSRKNGDLHNLGSGRYYTVVVQSLPRIYDEQKQSQRQTSTCSQVAPSDSTL